MGDYQIFSHTCVGVHVLHACIDHEIGNYLPCSLCNLNCMKYMQCLSILLVYIDVYHSAQ